MKKCHYKTINENSMSETYYLLCHVEGIKFELKHYEKSFDGAGIPISSEIICITNLEVYIEQNQFSPCCWSGDIVHLSICEEVSK